MTLTDTAWAGLSFSKTDSRRVDAKGKWNFFWAVVGSTDVALVLQLSELPNPIPPLPKLKNLELAFQTLVSGPIFIIRLKENEHLELFEILCRDVVTSAERAATEIAALERAVSRSFRWHYLLRGGRGDFLSEKQQKGLVAELQMLQLIAFNLGIHEALVAWTGPAGAPKDFELECDCIEVKARRSAAQPFVTISNEYQLSDVPNRGLWLAVFAVDRLPIGHGMTLTDHVLSFTSRVRNSAPSAMLDWESRLADVGYDESHDYSAWPWSVSDPEFYRVGDGFPRVTSSVPIGVSDVSYSISLVTCAPFLTRGDIVEACLFQGASRG